MFKKIFSFGLLVFIPISVIGHLQGWNSTIIFVTAAIAILPLAGWLSTATEEISVVLGPSWGGLLNATFGNATELIIAIVALNAGFTSVVKASITGSIIGNLLLVMACRCFWVGCGIKSKNFSQPWRD